MTSPAEVKAQFPDLSEIDDSVIQGVLDLAISSLRGADGVTAVEIRSRFIAFSQFELPVIQSTLSMVEEVHIDPEVWQVSPMRREATILATAHFLMLELLQQALITATATGVTKGQSQSINTLSGKNHWELTIYGLQFKDLSDSVPIYGGIAFGG